MLSALVWESGQHADWSTCVYCSLSFFYIYDFLMLAVLSLHWCAGPSLTGEAGRLFTAGVRASLWWLLSLRTGLSAAWASVAAARGLSSCGSQAPEHRQAW